MALAPRLPAGRVRIVDSDTTKTLREQIQPGDEIVHIVNRHVLDLEPVGPRQAMLEQAVASADEVLLIRVIDAVAQVIWNGHWVQTLVDARIEAVYKAPLGSARIGAERRFAIGGGAVKIDGVTVLVMNPVPYERDQRYLAFFGRSEVKSGLELYPPFGAMPLLKIGDTFLAYPGLSEHLNGITTRDLTRALESVRSQVQSAQFEQFSDTRPFATFCAAGVSGASSTGSAPPISGKTSRPKGVHAKEIHSPRCRQR